MAPRWRHASAIKRNLFVRINNNAQHKKGRKVEINMQIKREINMKLEMDRENQEPEWDGERQKEI